MTTNPGTGSAHPAPEHDRTLGARPAAEVSEAAAAEHVRLMFNNIAPSYDRLNHLLSFGLDRLWWRRAARAFAPVLRQPQARVLDLCCGTGDMTAALLALRPTSGNQSGARPLLAKSSPLAPTEAQQPDSLQPRAETSTPTDSPIPVTGLDFSAEMLARARTKYAAANALWIEGDAMQLPYPDGSFNLVTAAFGFRNLRNYAAALAEIHRVLAPGGQLGILEANQPGGLRGALYNLYFKHILPIVGGILSGDRPAYRYLPASVERFPRPPRMLAMLSEAGFAQPLWTGYLLHAAGLYQATKPSTSNLHFPTPAP